MSEVKRFFTALGFDPEPYVEMIEDTDGNYVYYEDYEFLRAKLSEVQKEVETLSETLLSNQQIYCKVKERGRKAMKFVEALIKHRDNGIDLETDGKIYNWIDEYQQSCKEAIDE